jgi:hypothetical protein
MTDNEHFKKAETTLLMDDEEQGQGQKGGSNTTTPGSDPAPDPNTGENGTEKKPDRYNTYGYWRATENGRPTEDQAKKKVEDAFATKKEEHKINGAENDIREMSIAEDEAMLENRRKESENTQANVDQRAKEYAEERDKKDQNKMEVEQKVESMGVPNYREHITDDQMQGWGRALARYGARGLKQGANAIDAATKALGEFRKLTRAFLSPNPMSAPSQMLASTMVGLNTMYDTIDDAGEIAGIKQGADRSIVMETQKGAQYYKDKDRAEQAANFIMQTYNDTIREVVGPDGDPTQITHDQLSAVMGRMDKVLGDEVARIRRENANGRPPSLEDRAIMSAYQDMNKRFKTSMQEEKKNLTAQSREGGAIAREYDNLDRENGQIDRKARSIKLAKERLDLSRQKHEVAGRKLEEAERNMMDAELADIENYKRNLQRYVDDLFSPKGEISQYVMDILGIGDSQVKRNAKGGFTVKTIERAADKYMSDALGADSKLSEEDKEEYLVRAEFLRTHLRETLLKKKRLDAAKAKVEGERLKPARTKGANKVGSRFFNATPKQQDAIANVTRNAHAQNRIREWEDNGHILDTDLHTDPRYRKLYNRAREIVGNMANLERAVYRSSEPVREANMDRAVKKMESYLRHLRLIEDFIWDNDTEETNDIFDESLTDSYGGMSRWDYGNSLKSRDRAFPLQRVSNNAHRAYNALSDAYESTRKEFDTLQFDYLTGQFRTPAERRKAIFRARNLRKIMDAQENNLMAKGAEIKKKQDEYQARLAAEKDSLAKMTVDSLRDAMKDKDSLKDYLRNTIFTSKGGVKTLQQEGLDRLTELASEMTPEERQVLVNWARSYKGTEGFVNDLMKDVNPDDMEGEETKEEDFKEGETPFDEKADEKLEGEGESRIPLDMEDPEVIKKVKSGEDAKDVLNFINETNDLDVLNGLWEKTESRKSNKMIKQIRKLLRSRIDELSPKEKDEEKGGETPLDDREDEKFEGEGGEGVAVPPEERLNVDEPQDENIVDGAEGDGSEVPLNTGEVQTEGEGAEEIKEPDVVEKEVVSDDDFGSDNIKLGVQAKKLLKEYEDALNAGNSDAAHEIAERIKNGKAVAEADDAKEQWDILEKVMNSKWNDWRVSENKKWENWRAPENEKNKEALRTGGPTVPELGEPVGDASVNKEKFKTHTDPRRVEVNPDEMEFSEGSKFANMTERDREVAKITDMIESVFGKKADPFRGLKPKDMSLDEESGRIKWDSTSSNKITDDLGKERSLIGKEAGKIPDITGTKRAEEHRARMKPLYERVSKKLEFIKNNFNSIPENNKKLQEYTGNDMLEVLDSLYRFIYAWDWDKPIPNKNRWFTKKEIKENKDEIGAHLKEKEDREYYEEKYGIKFKTEDEDTEGNSSTTKSIPSFEEMLTERFRKNHPIP